MLLVCLHVHVNTVAISFTKQCVNVILCLCVCVCAFTGDLNQGTECQASSNSFDFILLIVHLYHIVIRRM